MTRGTLTQHFVEQIREFVDTVDSPEKWRISIPVNQYDEVVESLDTVKESGTYYQGISICHTNTRTRLWIEYSSSLSTHIESVNTDDKIDGDPDD